MPSHYLFYIIKKVCSCIKKCNFLVIVLFLIYIYGCRTDPKITPEQFERQAPVLKKKQAWSECIKQGDKALANLKDQKETPKNKRNEARVLLAQASPQFYLGSYKECYKAAKHSFTVASSNNDQEALITSLYLQSAAKRALKELDEAISLINNAMKALNEAKLDLDPVTHRQLTAKVYFNSSAIYTDLEPYNLIKAKQDIRFALKHFREDVIQNERDIKRCERRLSTIELRETNYLEAKTSSTRLISYYKNKPSSNRDHREYMLCLEILGQAKYHLGEKNSKAIMSKAIGISKKLKAKEDEKRITRTLAIMKSSKAK